MWDLIVSVPDHCLSFYFIREVNERENDEVMMRMKTVLKL